MCWVASLAQSAQKSVHLCTTLMCKSLTYPWEINWCNLLLGTYKDRERRKNVWKRLNYLSKWKITVPRKINSHHVHRRFRSTFNDAVSTSNTLSQNYFLFKCGTNFMIHLSWTHCQCFCTLHNAIFWKIVSGEALIARNEIINYCATIVY